MNYSSKGLRVYDDFKNHLNNKNMKYQSYDDDLVISLIAQGNDLPQQTLIKVIDDRNVVLITSPIPGRFPDDKRMEAAVAVAIANYGMLNGNFELDMSDGEVRFKIAQGFHGIEFSDELIEYLLGITFITTDRYNDKFFSLSKGFISLEQFIEQEGKM